MTKKNDLKYDGLSAIQTQAIVALMTETSITAAANKVQVTPQTIYRWLNDDPEFMTGLRRAEHRAIETAVRRLASLTNTAVLTLQKTMMAAGDDVSVAAKLRAADIVLSRVLSLRELVGLEDRLAEIEAKIEAVSEHTKETT